MRSDKANYDRGAGVNTVINASELDDVVRVERLAGIDHSNGICSPRSHGLDGLQTATYRIE